MIKKISTISCLAVVCVLASCTSSKKQGVSNVYQEPHRPQIHFSPAANWMNDPNGMVFYNNIYHLFYQFHPNSTVWGPMHWGHATSKDMVHWEHQPIALYPDSLGTIFSGSAVADIHNTSGFGKDGKVPLVAIFTHHDAKGERTGSNTFQNQSIAYSLDDGKTWTKYAGNPVVHNPGIRDFRDPKVSWFEAGKKWIMTLATLDHITFYSSPDLKQWKKESEFGKEVGAHGGVWECPDLFPLDYNGQKIWILVVNLNPGGPNGGSATQYFTGQFDGSTFTPYQTDTRWLDYGPDEYAGITWSNTGDRKVFLGWMSNWQYADRVPTEKWRSAMTVARDLGLQKIGEKYLVTSQPVRELNGIAGKTTNVKKSSASQVPLPGQAKLRLTTDKLESFAIVISNDAGEKVEIGYDKAANNYYIDRTNSGKVSFEKGFGRKQVAPRLASGDQMDLTLIVDKASVELFADNGLSVMTAIFFPNSDFNKLTVSPATNFNTISLTDLKRIW